MKTNSLHSVILSLLFCVGTNSVSAQTFSGGVGNSISPYQISNQADLSVIMTKVASSGNPDTLYFKMTTDITLTGTWTPMGNSVTPFRGHFDGQHYRITGLRVSPGSDRGLFGYTQNADISRLSVETFSSMTGVEAEYNGAILVGTAVGGMISEVRTSGFVKATNDRCGGLAGSISGTAVFNCRSTAAVGESGNNSSEFGGLVGSATNGAIISQCYATGNIVVGGAGQSGTKAGGLVGVNTNSTISDCFATGTVTSDMTNVGSVTTGSTYYNSTCGTFQDQVFTPIQINLGGLVGINTGTVERCYAQGNVVTKSIPYDIAINRVSSSCPGGFSYTYSHNGAAGYPSNFAGVVGYNNGGNVHNCVANNPTITGGARLVGGGTPATGGSATASIARATYTGFNWDFSNNGVWTIVATETAYPLLQKSLINKFVTHTDMCSGVAKAPSTIIASFSGSATGTFTYDLTAWTNGVPTTLTSNGVAPFNNIAAHTVPKATEAGVYIKVKTTTAYNPAVTFDTIVATVHPQPTARIVACDTTLGYGYPQDSAMIKIELTGTPPFNYTYARYDAAHTSGLNIARTGVKPVHDPYGQGNLYWEDRFYILPDTIARSVTTPPGGDQPVYTGFNLVDAIKVTDNWGGVSGVTTPLARPDTVTINPLPLMSFVYDNSNDTTLCNESLFPKKIFKSPTVTGAFSDSMHYDWKWINTSTATAGEIGMPYSTGRDSIPAFTANNASSSPLTVQLEVTPGFINKFGGTTYNDQPDTISITVNPAPRITTQPTGGEYGSVTALSVVASGEGLLGYSWSNGAETVSTSASYTPASGNVPAGTYTVTITTNCGSVTSDNVTVTPKLITSTTSGSFYKPYNGNTVATPTVAYALNGVVGSDDVMLNGNVSFTFDNANAGTNKAVTATNWTLTGTAAGNYNLAAFPATVGEITKAPLTVTAKEKEIFYGDNPATAIPAADKWYDISGFVNGEGEASLTSDPVVSIDPSITATSAVGTYSGKVLVSGGSATNYEFTSYIPNTLYIRQASGADYIDFPALPQNLIYSNSPVNLSASHALGKTVKFRAATGSETLVNIIQNGAQWQAVSLAAGSAVIEAYLEGDNDVADEVKQQPILFGKAALTVTARNQERAYNTANPVVTNAYDYSAFVNAADENKFTTQATAIISDTNYPPTKPVGDYADAVTVSGGDHPSYHISYVAGMLSIKNAVGNITFPLPGNRTYGDADFNLTATHVSGAVVKFQSLDTDIIEITGAEGSQKAHIKKGGNVTIKAYTENVPNYADASATQTIRINKMAVAVRPDNVVRDYGQSNPVFTFSVSPVPAYNEPVSVLGTIAMSCTATETSEPGQYDIIATGTAETDNYTITYNPGVLTVLGTNTSISGVTVNGQATVKNADDYSILAACGENSAVISVIADANATVRINGVEQNPLTFTLANYGKNVIPVTVTAQNGTTANYTITIDKPLPFDQIVLMRWNNTLTVINNPANNGGYTFTSYKWFRNGQEIGAGQSWSKGKEGELLNSTDVYYVVVTAQGVAGEMRTCESSVTLRGAEVKALPNPVSQGQTLYVEANVDSKLLEGAVIEVYNSSGIRMGEIKVQGRLTPIDIRYPAGVHFFKLRGKDGFSKTLKVIVK